MREKFDPAKAETYPPNVQAIVKRQAPTSAWLNQNILELDVEDGWVKIGYDLGQAHFNRFGALHGGSIACVMDDVLAVAAGMVAK
jgi:acyl-coenzyme A thioesterase PaaI-like protein